MIFIRHFSGQMDIRQGIESIVESVMNDWKGDYPSDSIKIKKRVGKKFLTFQKSLIDFVGNSMYVEDSEENCLETILLKKIEKLQKKSEHYKKIYSDEKTTESNKFRCFLQFRLFDFFQEYLLYFLSVQTVLF